MAEEHREQGISVLDSMQNDFCERGQYFSSTSQVMEASLNVVQDGRTVSMKRKQVTVSATSTKDMQPCTQKWDGDTSDEDEACLSRIHSVTEARSAGGASAVDVQEDELEVIQPQQLVMKKTAKGVTFVIGGSRLVTFNDWTGKLEYSGKNVPPKYSLTNGSQKVSGELSTGDSMLSLTTAPALSSTDVHRLYKGTKGLNDHVLRISPSIRQKMPGNSR